MIGLVDCNNFFVSCERLFRPDLLRKPVLVLSSNDGCVVSRSQEVKDIGVLMGAPYFQIKDTCEKADITVFSSNFKLYRDISRRVMHALKEEFGEIEIYSIDEAFFTVPDAYTPQCLQEIRNRIVRKTGIPVSIGVAGTKTLAKIANRVVKQRDVNYLQPDTSDVFFMSDKHWLSIQKQLSCGSVWGIGRQMTKKLSDAQIVTVSDLLMKGRDFLSQIGGVVGERIYFELTGRSSLPIGDSMTTGHASYTSTRSFRHTTHDMSVLHAALMYHTNYLGQKLRKNKVCIGQISIYLGAGRYSDYALRERLATQQLLSPTNDTFTLTRIVTELCNKLYDPEIPYKKAGVVLSGVVPESIYNKSLFSTEDNHKTEALSGILDSVSQKFGSRSITVGSVSTDTRWQEMHQKLSQEYTTKWNAIAKVHAR